MQFYRYLTGIPFWRWRYRFWCVGCFLTWCSVWFSRFCFWGFWGLLLFRWWNLWIITITYLRCHWCRSPWRDRWGIWSVWPRDWATILAKTWGVFVQFQWIQADWGHSFFLRIILWGCWWSACRNWGSCRLSCVRRAILCVCSWFLEKILVGCWVGSYSIESTFYFLFFTYLNIHGKLQNNPSHHKKYISKQNI